MGIMHSPSTLQPAGMHAKATARTAGALTREYLTFRLGQEEYGIDILKVQEIRGYEEPTHIANAPPHLKGVVNLRGVIVPIVDLRMRLGCQNVQYNGFTVSVILHLSSCVVGIVVDAVSDVIELAQDAIRPAPQMSAALDAQYITGIGQLGERMLILLDIERLMLSPSMGLTSIDAR